MFPSFFTFLTVAILPVCAVTQRTRRSYVPPGAICQDHQVTITSTGSKYPWIAPKWTNDSGLIDFVSDATIRSGAPSSPPVGAPVNETATYTISGTYCTPRKQGNKSSTLLLATHGLSYDRSYWNPSYKPKTYNYVQHAINEGYSIFFYDRLGIGASQRVSGFCAQLNTQTPILISLAQSLKKGLYTLPNQPPPKKLILIGHSFGSYLSNAAIAANPTIADAAVLTGHNIVGLNLQLVIVGLTPCIANIQNRSKYGSYDIGYISIADLSSNILSFFKAPMYEEDVAQFSFNNKQPFAISEVVNLSPTQFNYDATAFKGPVLIVNGEFDHIVCDGYCPGLLNASFGNKFSNLETHIQPLAGHSLNLATNTTGYFGVIDSFLARNEL